MMTARIGRVSVLALVGACGLIALYGLQSADSAAPPAPTLPSKAVDRGPIVQGLRYHNVGLVLEPPGLAKATIPSSAAVSTCTTGDSVCPPGLTGRVNLALVTTPDAGTAKPDGSIDPLMNKKLVYVMTWTGVPCAPEGGPPPAPGSPPIAPEVSSCTVLSFVDAKSGAVLYGVQTNNP